MPIYCSSCKRYRPLHGTIIPVNTTGQHSQQQEVSKPANRKSSEASSREQITTSCPLRGNLCSIVRKKWLRALHEGNENISDLSEMESNLISCSALSADINITGTFQCFNHSTCVSKGKFNATASRVGMINKWKVVNEPYYGTEEGQEWRAVMSHYYKFRILTLTLTSAAHTYSSPSKRLGFNGNFPSLKFIQFTPAPDSVMHGRLRATYFLQGGWDKKVIFCKKKIISGIFLAHRVVISNERSSTIISTIFNLADNLLCYNSIWSSKHCSA